MIFDERNEATTASMPARWRRRTAGLHRGGGGQPRAGRGGTPREAYRDDSLACGYRWLSRRPTR